VPVSCCGTEILLSKTTATVALIGQLRLVADSCAVGCELFLFLLTFLHKSFAGFCDYAVTFLPFELSIEYNHLLDFVFELLDAVDDRNVIL